MKAGKLGRHEVLQRGREQASPRRPLAVGFLEAV